MTRLRTALSAEEWTAVAAMAGVVLVLHVVGFGVLLAFVVPAHLHLGTTGAFSAGVGVTAYVLGVRHAFDADHIAAIDNTTRKLMGEGRRPLGVGFFFALGHSTVVFVLAVLLAFGVRALAGPVRDGDSALQQVTGVIGPTVSGTFLWLVGALNVAILLGIVRAYRAARRGGEDGAALAERLTPGGPMSRVLGRATRAIRRPWQMYPLGVLFGLGFDTATEVSLLFLAAGAAGAGLPWYALLCLPVLFAAGMALFDTLDGSFMSLAYGWAFARPERRVFYNATVTLISIVVALGIGTIELAGVAAERFGLRGGLWDVAAGVDLNVVGYAVVALFALAWALAAAVWRFGRLEERLALPGADERSAA
jgi:nickel/cobalt transporter (NiCoT) family protein